MMELLNITHVTAINVILDLYNALILFFIIVNLKKNRTNKWLVHCAGILIAFAFSDSLTWLLDGTPSKALFVVLKISHFIFYMVQPFIFLSFIHYIFAFLNNDSKNYYLWAGCYIIVGIYMLVLIFTPFMGLYYSFSDSHVYSRGSHHYLSVVINGFIIFSGFIFLLKNKKIITKLEFFCFFLFFLVPTISEFIQLYYYGVSLIVTGLTVPIIIIFMNIHNDLENRLRIANDNVIAKEKELISLQTNTIIRLSNLVENRNQNTGNHVMRIIKYVECLCLKCKENQIYPNTIDDLYIERLVKAVPMHDIGKITIPDSILLESGKLTEEQKNQIKNHVIEGAKIVKNVLAYENDNKLIRMAENVALYHHERWDGSGYPKGLSKHSIPLSARIMSLADVFDALVTMRVYKEDTLNLEDAFAIIESGAEKNYDPILVEQFMLIKPEIKKILEEYGV
ncbi:MAG: HD domain-containing protein [Treponema sp.]|nr:HD domain-containing protein [Treponema sp.]